MIDNRLLLSDEHISGITHMDRRFVGQWFCRPEPWWIHDCWQNHPGKWMFWKNFLWAKNSLKLLLTDGTVVQFSKQDKIHIRILLYLVCNVARQKNPDSMWTRILHLQSVLWIVSNIVAVLFGAVFSCPGAVDTKMTHGHLFCNWIASSRTLIVQKTRSFLFIYPPRK